MEFSERKSVNLNAVRKMLNLLLLFFLVIFQIAGMAVADELKWQPYQKSPESSYQTLPQLPDKIPIYDGYYLVTRNEYIELSDKNAVPPLDWMGADDFGLYLKDMKYVTVDYPDIIGILVKGEKPDSIKMSLFKYSVLKHIITRDPLRHIFKVYKDLKPDIKRITLEPNTYLYVPVNLSEVINSSSKRVDGFILFINLTKSNHRWIVLFDINRIPEFIKN